MISFTFENELWRWTSRRALFTFVTLTEDVEEPILAIAGDLLNGWDSVRVDAQIGSTTFRTSIFPLSEAGHYALPVKRSVRQAEGLELGDTVHVTLDLIDF